MILLTGAALVVGLVGVLIGLVLIVWGAAQWLPALLLIPALAVYVLRPMTTRDKRKHTARRTIPLIPLSDLPHRARPPIPSSLDDPHWL